MKPRAPVALRHALAPATRAKIMLLLAFPRLTPWASVCHALRAFASDGPRFREVRPVGESSRGRTGHACSAPGRGRKTTATAKAVGPQGAHADLARGAGVRIIPGEIRGMAALWPLLALRQALAPATRAKIMLLLAFPRLTPWASVCHALRAFASDGPCFREFRPVGESSRGRTGHVFSPRKGAQDHSPRRKPWVHREHADLARGAGVRIIRGEIRGMAALWPLLALRHALAPATRAKIMLFLAFPRLTPWATAMSRASRV